MSARRIRAALWRHGFGGDQQRDSGEDKPCNHHARPKRRVQKCSEPTGKVGSQKHGTPDGQSHRGNPTGKESGHSWGNSVKGMDART